MEKKVKIAYLAHNRFPTEKAHGVQISAMCSAFVHNGSEVTLVVMRYKTSLTQTEDVIKEIQSVHQIDERVRIVSIKLPFVIALKKIGYLIQTLLFTVKTITIESVRTADVIFTRDDIVAFMWLLFGKKVIFEVHTHRGSWLWGFVCKRAYVIAISHGLKDAILKIVPGARCAVLPDAVDLEKFNIKDTQIEARKKLDIDPLSHIIVCTASLYNWKGVRTLLDAVKNAYDPSVKLSYLYMVGGTPDAVNSFKKEYSHDAIKFVGHVPYNLIPFYLRAADVVVIPNSGKDIVASVYTSPLKLFEYMASGTTIVASDVPAIREIVDEKSVYFMEPDNAQSCEKAIVEALSSNGSRAEHAKELVQKYSWNARAYAIIQNIIQSPR